MIQKLNLAQKETKTLHPMLLFRYKLSNTGRGY